MALEKIIALDHYVASLVNTSNVTANWLAWVISISVIAFIASAIYYWWMVKRDKKVCLKLVVGSISLYLAVEIIKIIVARSRPILENSFSFPSNHTALAAMLALFLPVVKKTTKILLAVWVVLVAISRIWLGKHWLTDVIVGAAIGIIVAILLKKWKIKIKN